MTAYYVLDIEVSDAAIDDPTFDYYRALDELENGLVSEGVDCFIANDTNSNSFILIVNGKYVNGTYSILDTIFDEAELSYTIR